MTTDEGRYNDLCDKADAALDSENHDEAIRLSTEAIALKLDDSLAYFMRSEAYHCKGDSNRACADHDYIIQHFPDDAGGAYFLKGLNYDHEGYNLDAIDIWSEGIRRAPNYFCYAFRAISYQHGGEYDKAIADFEHALKLDPYSEAAKEGLAEAKRKRDVQGGHDD